MNKIKELRELKGVTQSELGQVLNVSKSTISKYENGSLDLSSTTIAILCDYFQVSANQLLGICKLHIPTPKSTPADPTLQKIIDLATGLTPTQRQKALKVLELFTDENSDTPAHL